MVQVWQKEITTYINTKINVWSETTLRSEKARLFALTKYNLNEPLELLQQLKAEGRSMYTIKTTFIRLSNFFKWRRAANPYATFLSENPQVFRNAYTKEQIKLTFAEAQSRIQSIPDLGIRSHAEFLLGSGLRLFESYKVQQEGGVPFVVGKGGKKRRVFSSVPTYLGDCRALRRELGKLGLKPHSLRKLFATRLVEKGFSPQDLCEVMGWSNINTALSYLQVKHQDVMANAIQAALT